MRVFSFLDVFFLNPQSTFSLFLYKSYNIYVHCLISTYFYHKQRRYQSTINFYYEVFY